MQAPHCSLLLAASVNYSRAVTRPAQLCKSAARPYQRHAPRSKHVTESQGRDSPSLPCQHSGNSHLEQQDLADTVQQPDRVNDGTEQPMTPVANSPNSSNLSGKRQQQQQQQQQLGEQLRQLLQGLHKQQSYGRQHQQQDTNPFRHFSLASHWDVSTGLGWQIKITNPLKLVFGKPWRKAVPLSILFFASTSIFTMLQSLKDGIVVHAMGADALPYLTTLGTLPASLAFFNFYRLTLVPSVPPQHLFFATAAPFLAFYTLFAVVLYPLAPALQSPTWLSWLSSALPEGASGLVAALQQWVYSLFYVGGDLWGPVVISLAFWTVADEVCSMSEAASLYPQLGLLANLGLVGSGRFIKAVHAAVGGDMGGVLKVLVLCMLLMSCVMFVCMADIYSRHVTMTPHADTHHQHSDPPHQNQQQHQQPSSSTHSSSTVSSSSSSTTHGSVAAATQAASYVSHPTGSRAHSRSSAVPQASWAEIRAVFARNPTAAALAVTVVAFSVSYRMFEYSYKHQLRLATADSAAYCLKLADVQSAVGAATIVMMITSKFIFKHLGWTFASLISPTAMLIAGTAFFTCSLLSQSAAAATIPGSLGCQPASAAAGWVSTSLAKLPFAAVVERLPRQEVMQLGLSAGFVTALTSSACHNSLFTPCKQMVYKIMPATEIKEAKAVVDLVGGQFAKSAAGWLVQALLLSCGNITAALPAMGVVYILAILAWLSADSNLITDMRNHEAQQVALRLQEQQHQQAQRLQQQQQQQPAYVLQPQQSPGMDGHLPLPKELALASGAGDELMTLHVPSPAGDSDKKEIASTLDTGLMQPDMVEDPSYWNSIYQELAADPLLLEAVVAGRAASPSSGRAEVKQQQPAVSQQAKTASGTVAGNKEALHTLFESY